MIFEKFLEVLGKFGEFRKTLEKLSETHRGLGENLKNLENVEYSSIQISNDEKLSNSLDRFFQFPLIEVSVSSGDIPIEKSFAFKTKIFEGFRSSRFRELSAWLQILG